MNENISVRAYEHMRSLGVSSRMVAKALNAPDHVRHLPLSHHLSYFHEFGGHTLRVMTTLDELVLTVSWTTLPRTVGNRPS
jgi:hypothetical protein